MKMLVLLFSLGVASSLGYIYRRKLAALPAVVIYFLFRGIWKALTGAHPKKYGVLGHTCQGLVQFCFAFPYNTRRFLHLVTPPDRFFPSFPIDTPDAKGVMLRHKSLPQSGGMVVGHSKMHLGAFHKMLNSFHQKGLHPVIFSIDYDLSPEARFPRALNQCVTGYRWLLAEAEKENISADRIYIAGDSAGGNLALATYSYLEMNEKSKLPLPAGMWLVSPWLVLDQKLAIQRKSCIENEKYDILSVKDISIKSGMYRPTESPKSYPESYIQPVEVKMESKDDSPYELYPMCPLPPTIISWGSLEMFNDDIANFAANAKKQGYDIYEVISVDLPHDAVLLGLYFPSHPELEKVCSRLAAWYTANAMTKLKT